jgi:hypothetical protein
VVTPPVSGSGSLSAIFSITTGGIIDSTDRYCSDAISSSVLRTTGMTTPASSPASSSSVAFQPLIARATEPARSGTPSSAAASLRNRG